MEDLRGKVVLITGSSTGIGAAVAKGFARHGARVGVHCNASVAEAEAVVAAIAAGGGEARLLRADVSRSADCDRLVDETVQAFGRLDVLVNNAGSLVQRAKLADITDDLYDRVLDVNVRSVVAMSRAVARVFERQGSGNIVNTTSVAARNAGGIGAALYAASKAFVSTFTRNIAKEYAERRIRVNAVAPGVILTPFHERFTSPELLETFRRTIPMAYLGSADECVGAYLFLASDSLAGYVTGQVIEVNGGQLMP